MMSGKSGYTASPQASTVPATEHTRRTLRKEPAQERCRGERHHRDAEDERERVLLEVAERCRGGAGDDADGSEDHGARSRPCDLRLRQIADRPDDVEPGDTQARDPDGHQRDDQTRARSDREAHGLDHERVARSIGGPEDGTRDERHEPSDAEAGDRAERSGGDRVDRALDREGPGEPAAGEPDRSQHAELGLALLGEHDEQVDQQQDPGEDAEDPDQAEDLGQPGALTFRIVEHQGLGRFDLDARQPLDRVAEIRHDRVGQRTRVEHPSVERHQETLTG